MQAITVAVQQKVEPVEKINVLTPHNITSASSEGTKQASFSDRVEQAKKEQPAEKTESTHIHSRTEKTGKSTDENTVKKNAAEMKEGLKITADKKIEPVKAAKSEPSKETKKEDTVKNTKQKKTDDKKTKVPKDDYSKELAYLQGTDTKKSADTPDAIIEQTQEYVDTDAEKAKVSLEKARRMSVESPQQFLSEQASVNSAKQTNAAAVNDAGLSAKEKDTKQPQKKEFALDKDGKIIVKDFRTDSDRENAKDVKNAQNKLVTAIKKDGDGSAQMSLTMPDQVQQNILSSSDQSASSSGSNFQAMLTNQIQQSADDFVKAGSIVLKDNNVGTIKLVLHPESLGNVKINLQLSDKTISGQIIVASQEAFNAFKESADNLKQAFIQNGFDMTGFTVAYSGENSGNGSFSNSRNEDSSNYSVATVSGSYDNAQLAEAIPAVGGSYMTADHSLNIVA
jgi:flagellar hook-length control protein FliK